MRTCVEVIVTVDDVLSALTDAGILPTLDAGDIVVFNLAANMPKKIVTIKVEEIS